jgi:sulfate adenylyltransferase subunit 1
MRILKVFTCGNVDDGKSTLLGRLLLDSDSISVDILHQLTELMQDIDRNRITV